MKKNVFILGLAVLALFTSCSGDDDSTSGDDVNPVGNYELVSVKTSKSIDVDGDGAFDDTELISFLACNSSLVLNENDTFVWERLDLNVNGGIEFDCSTSMESGTYHLTDGGLQLTCVHNSVFLMNLSGNKVKYIDQRYLETSPGNGEYVLVTYTYQK